MVMMLEFSGDNGNNVGGGGEEVMVEMNWR